MPNGRGLFEQSRAPIGLFLWEFTGAGAFTALATAGLDFAVLDMEHGGFSWREIANALAGARATTLSALVRVPELSRSAVGRALDLGADGVIAPHINNREQSEELVRYTRYAPIGARNVAIGSPHDGYGATGLPLEELAIEANNRICCIALVETRQGVDAIEEIVQTPGLDAIWLGFADLSQSLGALGDYSSSTFRMAEERVLSACRAAGMPIGVIATSAEAVSAQLARGYRPIALGTDVSVLQTALSGIIRQMQTAGEE